MSALGSLSRRGLLQAGGALVVSFALPNSLRAQPADGRSAAPGRTLDVNDVDAYLAVDGDGNVTLYTGKVDLGTGLRIALPQIAAEELGIGVNRIEMVEGDTALTPNQGPTAGSTGVMRGGMQIRQAAATARAVLIERGAAKLGRPASELDTADGEVRPRAGGAGIGFGSLIGGERFNLRLDPKAPLRDPAGYTVVGKPLPRPDIPAKVTGQHTYMQDFRLPAMLHARVIRPPQIGATLQSVDENSIKATGAQLVRIKDFLAVVAAEEWDAVCAARDLKAVWTGGATVVAHGEVANWLKAGPFDGEQAITRKGDVSATLAASDRRVSGSFYWPMQSHGSMGPSCAVADVKPDSATIWSASQATHRFQATYAKIAGLPEAKVRVIYLDGAGCYGMNGHDDAAADAALLSKELGKPVRVQWSREDEHGWDPKGPPQYLSIEAALAPDNTIDAWRTEMWIPKATAGLPNIPLLGPEAAGIPQPQGISTGLLSQNGDPPYAAPNVEVLVHWLKDAPLRPSNIRAPGKVANSFAVESITDELASLAGVDPVAFRVQGISDPRGLEVIRRTAALMGWKPRNAPARNGSGRGFAYVHYKHNETYVGMGMDVTVDRASGAIRVQRVVCAHDCGQVINPDGTRAQIEGCILQTLSRALHEEVTVEDGRVTSTDWASYPILTMPEVPRIVIELIDRPADPPLGAGEAAAAPVAAALANAVFDATGARLRTVPFTSARVKAAIERGQA
jgi:CO/xanthine dehydrogenase Mo-binding subunit